MKVLIADDSILFRRVMAEALASLPARPSARFWMPRA